MNVESLNKILSELSIYRQWSSFDNKLRVDQSQRENPVQLETHYNTI